MVLIGKNKWWNPDDRGTGYLTVILRLSLTIVDKLINLFRFESTVAARAYPVSFDYSDVAPVPYCIGVYV